MQYKAPLYDVVLQNIPQKSLLFDETQPHLTLADQLTVIIEYFAAQGKPLDKKSFQSLLGAHVYCLETISQEYYVHSPEYKKGYIYNSGSPLYSFIMKSLNITPENPLTARDKLIFLNKFDQFITKNAEELDALLKPLTVKELKLKMKDMLNNCLVALTENIAELINSIPTEKVMTERMAKLPEDYHQKKTLQSQGWFSYFVTNYFYAENQDRIRLAQLAELIANIQCEDEHDLPSNVMTRSQRIKIGMLLYITKSIENEYWIRSAFNSSLYASSKTILNTQNLNVTQTLACLSAFHSLINSHEERTKLEKAAREHFKEKNLLENIDITLKTLGDALIEMETAIENSTTTNWPATKALSNIGKMFGAAPGYGMGLLTGYTIGETQSTQLAKNAIGAAATQMATAVFQSTSAGYFSFAMGDFLIKSTLTRAFAKLFEFVGMTMGGVAGGLIGFFVFDLSYKSFSQICRRCLNYCDANPIQMRNADRELLECLSELSPDLFSEEKQNKILYVQGLEKQAASLKM